MSPSKHINLVKNFIKYVEEELCYITFYIDEDLVAILNPEDYTFRDNSFTGGTSKSMIFNMRELKLYSNYDNPIIEGYNINFKSEDSFEYLTLNTYLEILKEEQ